MLENTVLIKARVLAEELDRAMKRLPPMGKQPNRASEKNQVIITFGRASGLTLAVQDEATGFMALASVPARVDEARSRYTPVSATVSIDRELLQKWIALVVPTDIFTITADTEHDDRLMFENWNVNPDNPVMYGQVVRPFLSQRTRFVMRDPAIAELPSTQGRPGLVVEAKALRWHLQNALVWAKGARHVTGVMLVQRDSALHILSTDGAHAYVGTLDMDAPDADWPGVKLDSAVAQKLTAVLSKLGTSSVTLTSTGDYLVIEADASVYALPTLNQVNPIRQRNVDWLLEHAQPVDEATLRVALPADTVTQLAKLKNVERLIACPDGLDGETYWQAEGSDERIGDRTFLLALERLDQAPLGPAPRALNAEAVATMLRRAKPDTVTLHLPPADERNLPAQLRLSAGAWHAVFLTMGLAGPEVDRKQAEAWARGLSRQFFRGRLIEVTSARGLFIATSLNEAVHVAPDGTLTTIRRAGDLPVIRVEPTLVPQTVTHV